MNRYSLATIMNYFMSKNSRHVTLLGTPNNLFPRKHMGGRNTFKQNQRKERKLSYRRKRS